jgi:hypothetical protein
MRQRYVITRSVPGHRALESHDTLEQAEKALKILNAHEQRNGRGTNYWQIVEAK